MLKMTSEQDAIRDLIRQMLQVSGLNATQLALQSGLAATTVTRFMNQPVKYQMTLKSLAKLSQTSGVAVPMAIAGAAGIDKGNESETALLRAFRCLGDREKSQIVSLSYILAGIPEPAQSGSNPVQGGGTVAVGQTKKARKTGEGRSARRERIKLAHKSPH